MDSLYELISYKQRVPIDVYFCAETGQSLPVCKCQLVAIRDAPKFYFIAINDWLDSVRETLCNRQSTQLVEEIFRR